jgi:hypothetical protein
MLSAWLMTRRAASYRQRAAFLSYDIAAYIPEQITVASSRNDRR